MRVMSGEGVFIASSGAVEGSGGRGLFGKARADGERDGGAHSLPEEAFASDAPEGSRREMLESIVLDERSLPTDMQRALFDADADAAGDEDDDGSFEELEDDFIALAAEGEDEAPAFDFDAHMRRLLAECDEDDDDEDEEDSFEFD